MAQRKDPVCGMTVDDKSGAAASDHKGKRYYFCGKGCKTKFDEHPEDYLGKT